MVQSDNATEPQAAGAGPTFFSVVHEFVEGKAEAWWAAIMGMDQVRTMPCRARSSLLDLYPHRTARASLLASSGPT